MPGVVDLHIHSNASDGILDPSSLVRLCLQRGLRTIALTDHDTTSGIEAALETAHPTRLHVIPGVEFSTDVPGAEVHILGYYIEWQRPALQDTLVLLRDSRWNRARQMVERLGGLGKPVEWAMVEALADGGAAGRPHVARAMVQAGHVPNVSEAFAQYIGRGGPAYVDRYKLAPEEAVALIRDSGGIPVLAHPVIFDASGEACKNIELDVLLPRLAAAGLQGIEARYPSYPAGLTYELIALADSLGLVTTGGTDFHGPGGSVSNPGEVWVPPAVVEALEQRYRELQNR